MRSRLLKLSLAYLAVAPIVVTNVAAVDLTGDSGAILTDVHNKVDKRFRIDKVRETWGKYQPGRLGDLLPEGTQVGTGDKSWAQISWPKVTTRIWEQTLVAIAPNKRIVYLQDGELLFNLDKQHSISENCEVWTKLIQARVHGTTFMVQSTPDYSRVTVLEGELELVNRLDNSVVQIKPGVIYEVRVGNPPPPIWVKPPTRNTNRNELHPVQPNGVSVQPNGASVLPFPPGKMKHSEEEIERTAQELSHGDPEKKKYALQKLRQMNIDETAAANKCYLIEHTKMTDAEMQKKAEELANHDPQKAQVYLNKFRSMRKNGALSNYGANNYYPQNLENDNGSVLTTPQVDTSEFTVLQRAKEKTKAAATVSKPAVVAELSSRAAPPISLFRTTKSATNLYLVNVDQVWKHKLVQGFSKDLDSLSLIQSELFALDPISRDNSYFDKNSNLLAKRNKFISMQASIIQSPADKSAQVGKEMQNERTLPGQSANENKTSMKQP